MNKTDRNVYWQINEKLFEQGSWLYQEEGRKWSFGLFFDPDAEEYHAFPGTYKIMVLKELFQSGITPALLDEYYRLYCKQTQSDRKQQDYGLQLLELIKELSAWNLGDLDNNAPTHWYRTAKADPPEVSVHDVTLKILDSASSDLLARLKHAANPSVRKRILFLEHSLTYPEYQIVGNEEPSLDQDDARLLNAMDA